MQVLSRHRPNAGAEDLIHRVLDRLKRHALMDALLLSLPPALAGCFVVALLYLGEWLTAFTALSAAIVILVFAAAVILFRCRPSRPSVRAAAGMVDEKSGAQDHFLTLATIDPAAQPAPFVARLSRQAESLGHRVELARDFPFRFKRSAFWSAGVSLIAGLLVYLILPPAPGAHSRPGARQMLAEIVEEMATRPRLRDLARELKQLSARLDEPKIPTAEKQVAIKQMEQRIEKQKKQEEERANRDLLSEAASALEGLEKEQQAAGGQGQRQQEQGAGGMQTNVPQRGEGEGKQNQSGSADGKVEPQAQSTSDNLQQRGTQATPKEPGQSKNQPGDESQNQKQPDPNQPSQDQTKEKAGKSQGDSKEGAGKQQASEEPPPQGGPPADRFYKPGEGKEGLAGKKGYVTVQLPEEVVADSEGESTLSKNAKTGRTRAKVPVSNVPLPAHVPNAPAEKQQVPLEYRGILR